MAPPPCCPRSLPVLMEDLVEEILLFIPPDEPAHLVRAALVCKPWRRILSDPGFLRRYRAFHRAPPLLGYLHSLDPDENQAGIATLTPTSVASPLSTQPGLECSWWAVDCRHGRVLIRTFALPQYLVVWDPITGAQKKLSLPGYCYYPGAVLCAVDGCDHLNCHDGPFLVVVAGSDLDYKKWPWVAIYSSETGLWSASISIGDPCDLATKPSLLIGDTLYFTSHSQSHDGEFGDTLKFNLGTHELSLIASPRGLGYQNMAMAIEVDGGELGFASVKEDNCIYMWSWQGDTSNGIGGWTHHMVMDLETLLPAAGDPFCICPYEVVGLLEGTNTIFISVSFVGLFTLDLKSKKVKKVEERWPYSTILPYTSFYTPDLAKA